MSHPIILDKAVPSKWPFIQTVLLQTPLSYIHLVFCDIIVGFLKEKMDLINYILTLGKSYLWTCCCKEIKPSWKYFKRILNKYQTEKYIAVKSNKVNLFKNKWKLFE